MDPVRERLAGVGGGDQRDRRHRCGGAEPGDLDQRGREVATVDVLAGLGIACELECGPPVGEPGARGLRRPLQIGGDLREPDPQRIAVAGVGGLVRVDRLEGVAIEMIGQRRCDRHARPPQPVGRGERGRS